MALQELELLLHLLGVVNLIEQPLPTGGARSLRLPDAHLRSHPHRAPDVASAGLIVPFLLENRVVFCLALCFPSYDMGGQL